MEEIKKVNIYQVLKINEGIVTVKGSNITKNIFVLKNILNSNYIRCNAILFNWE